MNKITKEWLKEQSACSGGYEWYLKNIEENAIKLIKNLIEEKKEKEHLNWANWHAARGK